MAKLRVFISSTYYDLKHIRSTIESFVEGLGYEPILSEKGSIAYNPDVPLDDSCYKEAQSSDIFVLIVGGRYGSIISAEKDKLNKTFYDRYESITKKEFNSAIEKDIPVYILVEKAVYSEYETFKRNRKKKDVEYAHVDSINIFYFLEEILSKPRNNPIQQFERHGEINQWLRPQWGGLFKDLLQRRNQQRQISSLSEQVDYLSETNKTLRLYMEELMKSLDKSPKSQNLINKESKRLEELDVDIELRKSPTVTNWLDNGFELPAIKEIISNSTSIDDYIEKMVKLRPDSTHLSKDKIVKYWKDAGAQWLESLNRARSVLGLQPLKFEE